jgi:thiosulfate/3-mercaptopyruvate sulfurtransferase
MTDIALDELQRRLGEVVLLDVRSEVEYEGAAGYPCDPRQGHIPGARNVPVQELLHRSAEELQALVGEPDGSELVCYCHSGGRSEHAAAALRAAGYDARNYPGSWHEWSRAVPE